MFPREYSDLADAAMSPLRRDICLHHVAATWGRYPRPPRNFEEYPAGTKHILSLPLPPLSRLPAQRCSYRARGHGRGCDDSCLWTRFNPGMSGFRHAGTHDTVAKSYPVHRKLGHSTLTSV